MKTTTANPDYNEVRITDWPDGGSNSTPGTLPGTDTRRPYPEFIVTFDFKKFADYPVNQPNYAPAFISNAGKYASLAELGHIFDPAQVINMNDPNSVSFVKNKLASRTHLDMIPGGGITLAIGRAEFKAFDADGKRASQLLDLFSLARNPSASPPSFGEKINVNTASREVLRTLAAGVTLDADPLFPTLAGKNDAQIGDRLADAILEQRAIAPLRSLSDFNEIQKTITKNGNNVRTGYFGELENLRNAQSNTPATIVLNDAGREQLFAKIMELVTFGSKDFRIVVKGEVLNPNGTVISRSSKEYIYRISPNRDPATGLVIPGNPPTLTKRYENTY